MCLGVVRAWGWGSAAMCPFAHNHAPTILSRVPIDRPEGNLHAPSGALDALNAQLSQDYGVNKAALLADALRAHPWLVFGSGEAKLLVNGSIVQRYADSTELGTDLKLVSHLSLAAFVMVRFEFNRLCFSGKR